MRFSRASFISFSPLLARCAPGPVLVFTAALAFSHMLRRKIVIVGGVAGGATAAARIHRVNPGAKVTIVERGADVSFANCGLPYHLGGDIPDAAKLNLHTPQSLTITTGANIRTRTEAVAIDRVKKTVKVRPADATDDSAAEVLEYDKLILAPGASPIVPKLPGVDLSGIYTLRTMDDMRMIGRRMAEARRCVVIGGGFIGLELCEQFRQLGKAVTLLEGCPHVMPLVDPELAMLVEASLRRNGVKLRLNAQVTKFEQAAPGVINVCTKDGVCTSADAVVMCIGVRPENSLALQSGLAVGPRGHIKVKSTMQTETDPNVYAVGDAVSSFDGVFNEQPAAVPLANVANQQARIAADHAVNASGTVHYQGSVGTGIVRSFNTTVGVTGWNAARLKAADVPFDTATVVGFDHAGYYPGATPIAMKVHYSTSNGRILGAQAVGEAGVDKRIDVLATCVTGRMMITQLSMLQLAYSPPFGSARDVVNVAALHARNKTDNAFKAVSKPSELPADVEWIDCRRPEQRAVKNIPFAKHEVTYATIVDDVKHLDKAKPYALVCQWGRLSYFSALAMQELGFTNVTSLSGGCAVHFPQYDVEFGKEVMSRL